MSDKASIPMGNNISENKSMHLPKQSQLKKQLREEIQLYISQLKQIEGKQSDIEILILRMRLIDSYGLSLERLDNLEAIFLHYCSHIFKTGKHMTFQRLQYQKSHLTMDRFFVFLKDFGLNTAKIDGSIKQVIDKNDLVLLFKRVSINAKDLNFEQFIGCLDKIGILYYDSMVNYNQKQQKIAEQRKKRKQNYLKSLKRRKAALQASKNGNKPEDDNNDKNEQNQDRQTEKEQKEQVQVDKLNDVEVNQNLNDKNIINPDQQIEGEVQKAEKEIQAIQNAQVLAQQPKINRDYLLQLTPQQKIQYFYQLINVDNSSSFKKKMRQLNLPLFQAKGSRAASQMQKLPEPRQETNKNVIQIEQQKRLQQLRNKIQQRKERDKGNTPHISKEDYQKRKKNREKQEIQSSVIVKRDNRKKKIDITQLQIDLSSLSNMVHENINFHRFNPQKMIQHSEEQDPYLEQYTSVKKTQRSEKRILSNFESNDGRSQIMLQKLKKRAQQIEIKEKNAQSKYASDSQSLSFTQHQVRKNRLVQKLMKIYKQ